MQIYQEERRELDQELDRCEAKNKEYQSASKSTYTPLLVDESISSPFQLTPRMMAVADEMAKIPDELKRSRAIFDWVEKHIQYDYSYNARHPYRSSKEVEMDGMGVCGEQSYLYAVMARRAGLSSGYVSVDVDAFGKDVHHACAWVMANGKRILVDPAYNMFDIKHKRFRYLKDSEATFFYNQWRNKR